jgi:hypothetical protein
LITPLASPEIVDLPTPVLPTFAPPATATPLPDPAAYRVHVVVRARYLAAALDAFMQVNARLQEDEGLVNEAGWRSEAQAALDELAAAAESLGAIGTVPPEYAVIADRLRQVGPEAQALRADYLTGIQTGDQEALRRAGEAMGRITELMAAAQAEMTTAGWTP